MFKRESKPLSEILRNFMNENASLKTKIAEKRAVRAWNELLGEGVAKYTTNVYLRRNTLFVHLSSSVLRAELLMNKESLVRRLNDYAEMQVVRNIVLR